MEMEVKLLLWLTYIVTTIPFLCTFLPQPSLLEGHIVASVSGYFAAADKASTASSGHNIYWLLRRIISVPSVVLKAKGNSVSQVAVVSPDFFRVTD